MRFSSSVAARAGCLFRSPRSVSGLLGLTVRRRCWRRLRTRLKRTRLGSRAAIVRGDIRALPFRKRVRFPLVMAPYGILQSLLRDADLRATLRSVARVVPRGGRFVVDLVPDLPKWQEYERRVSLTGRGPQGGWLTLIETVRQDANRQMTIFDQEFVERVGRRRQTYRSSIAFRTLTVPQVSGRLERAGFRIDAVLGTMAGGSGPPTLASGSSWRKEVHEPGF